MNIDFQIIKKSSLFEGIAEKELEGLLGCLAATREQYAKNQFIFRVGDAVSSLGLILSGSVHIIKEDFWGNRNIISKAKTGQLFGEAYACTPGAKLSVSVQALEPCKIVFFDVGRILTTCSSACEFHSRLIRNLLAVMAEKNLMMNEKLSHMTQRSTREKLLSYLSEEARRQGGSDFVIPFNRQQLADYLSVDRSAMSNELCKMRDGGLLTFSKNSFTLKDPAM